MWFCCNHVHARWTLAVGVTVQPVRLAIAPSSVLVPAARPRCTVLDFLAKSAAAVGHAFEPYFKTTLRCLFEVGAVVYLDAASPRLSPPLILVRVTPPGLHVVRISFQAIIVTVTKDDVSAWDILYPLTTWFLLVDWARTDGHLGGSPHLLTGMLGIIASPFLLPLRYSMQRHSGLPYVPCFSHLDFPWSIVAPFATVCHSDGQRP